MLEFGPGNGEVAAVMGSPALFAPKSALRDQCSHNVQIPQFELREVHRPRTAAGSAGRGIEPVQSFPEALTATRYSAILPGQVAQIGFGYVREFSIGRLAAGRRSMVLIAHGMAG